MESITLNCPAKINLSLDILGKRNDGYHEIDTIMQTINLEDKVTIAKSKEFYLSVKGASLPLDDKNIALKVAKIMFSEFNLTGGVNIHIDKNIPVAAGLAGGSTDAAGVIEGINLVYNLNLSKEEMMCIAEKVGSDVPYLIEKGTALCKGRGEKVYPLNSLKGYNVLIAKPSISVSTKWVYDNLNTEKINKRPDNKVLLKCIEENNISMLSENLVNVLETVTIREYKIIDEIKNKMIEYGALGSLMSGSGPTVFGIFKDNINKCYEDLKQNIDEVYKCKMI